MLESEGMSVDALESVLDEVLSAAGASGAALVDAVTGFTYAESGDCAAAGTGHEVWHLLSLIEDRLHEAGAEGELENVVVTGSRTYHVVHVVARQGDPVLLSTVLDRSDTNLALASRRIGAVAEGLFA
ncbi:hypothetical protein [Streptomyces sp. NBC_01477]|uniref:hypothetical protein n=1 Tax=Streptomyces sp. NBC_01477 TaxID=2976015 RepID=UPI002E337957|nr:hypothetical protein [Streptomyces sp. NBC_01477]